jgi:transcriptional regulator with XRE-family HTH domain
MIDDRNNVGTLLRDWRKRRGLSQLSLAVDADISQRHLSFVESGKSRPSREMILHLARQLDVPLRERNAILVAGGFAPYYPQRPLQSPELAPARDVIERILQGHMPHPALVVDRYWTLITSNNALTVLLNDVAPQLLNGDVNVLRLSLHPDGLAPRIINLGEWRDHILERLAHEAEHTADPKLMALYKGLTALPGPLNRHPRSTRAARNGTIAVPIHLTSDHGPLSFISTTTVFGTAADVTLAEITIETFYPSDDRTASIMARLANREE